MNDRKQDCSTRRRRNATLDPGEVTTAAKVLRRFSKFQKLNWASGNCSRLKVAASAAVIPETEAISDLEARGCENFSAKRRFQIDDDDGDRRNHVPMHWA